MSLRVAGQSDLSQWRMMAHILGDSILQWWCEAGLHLDPTQMPLPTPSHDMLWHLFSQDILSLFFPFRRSNSGKQTDCGACETFMHEGKCSTHILNSRFRRCSDGPYPCTCSSFVQHLPVLQLAVKKLKAIKCLNKSTCFCTMWNSYSLVMKPKVLNV